MRCDAVLVGEGSAGASILDGEARDVECVGELVGPVERPAGGGDVMAQELIEGRLALAEVRRQHEDAVGVQHAAPAR